LNTREQESDRERVCVACQCCRKSQMMNHNEKGATLGGMVPAVVVEVPSTAVTQPQQPHVVYVVQQQHPPAVPQVRVNSGMECCYPITMADPVEMVRARNVAIFHVCAEATAILFCRSEWGIMAVLLGIPSSSVVACCCKQRETFLVWGLMGAVVATLHAKAAVTEAASDNDDAFMYLAQIMMCVISLHVVFF
ncbi:unnamed protein product, partial [Ectocarpus sp. 12 AP-2014]